MSSNNCVKYKGMSLQIPPVEDSYHFVRAGVMVHEHGDERVSVYHGKLRLGRYDREGRLKKQRRKEQTENPDRRGSPQFRISLFGLRPAFVSDCLRVHLALVETYLKKQKAV